jgi:hypothetical protein
VQRVLFGLSFLGAAVGSVLITAAGLWLLLYQGDSEFGPFGWVFLVVGVLFMVVNVVLRNWTR